MEKVLINGFSEMTMEETVDMEGGCLIELAVGLLVVTGMAVAAWDLNNCYTNAYNEVMMNAGK